MQLSVVIPYYNIEDSLLIRCLSSVSDAGLPAGEYEVVLVDDGSETVPHKAQQHFAGNTDLHWRRIDHCGLGAARNHGMAHARGEYILFLDADDYLYTDTLAPILDRAVRNRCDILRFGYRFCTSTEPEHPRQPATPIFTEPVDGDTYLHTRHLPGMACVYLFRRELCTGLGLKFPERGFIEDEAFTTLLHDNARSIVETNLRAYAYYRRAGSITLTPSAERQSELIRYHFEAIRKIHAYRHEQQNRQRPTRGVERKLHALTVDIIRRILTHRDWQAEWSRYASRLEALHLFPLKECHYTPKYRLFSLLANRAWGRRLLRLLLTNGIH